MKKRFLLSLGLLLCLMPAVPVSGQEGKKGKPGAEVDVVEEEMEAFKTEMRRLFQARRWDDLEKIAAELRTKKAVFGNGGWKLVEFYEAFEPKDAAEEVGWLAAEALHGRWNEAKPDSITARVALGAFLTSYAWAARGSGWADTVTDQGWEFFRNRLARGEKVLKHARTLPDKDPMWWFMTLRIGVGQGMERADFEALVKEGLAYEPEFWRFHTMQANYLMPRWHGAPGDWEAYALKAADKYGVEAYARIAMYMSSMHTNLFEESEASWPKVQEGLEKLRAQYPAAPEFTSYLALFAGQKGERELAKSLLDELGGTYIERVWESREFYQQFSDWVRDGGKKG